MADKTKGAPAAAEPKKPLNSQATVVMTPSSSSLPATGLDTGLLPGEAPQPKLSHEKLLVDKTHFDLAIMVQARKFNAHTAVLYVRMPAAFTDKDRQTIDKTKKKKANAAVQIDLARLSHVTTATFQQVLQWLHAGSLRLSSMDPCDVLRLDLAAKQLKLDRLSYFCEQHIGNIMDSKNVFELLKLANETGEAHVKDMCITYAHKHYEDFVGNAMGIPLLGIELFQQVVVLKQNNKTPELPVVAPPPDQFQAHFKELYEKMPFADAVTKIGSKSIKFHKAVLAAHSDGFARFFQTKEGSGDEVVFPQDQIALQCTRPLSSDAFEAMLRFVYYGDVNVAPIPATELIPFCKSMFLTDLHRVCEGVIKANIATATAVDILGVTYLKHMAESEEAKTLRKDATTFLITNLTQIDLAPLRKMDPHIALDVLFATQAHEKASPSGAKDWVKPPSASSGAAPASSSSSAAAAATPSSPPAASTGSSSTALAPSTPSTPGAADKPASNSTAPSASPRPTPGDKKAKPDGKKKDGKDKKDDGKKKDSGKNVAATPKK